MIEHRKEIEKVKKDIQKLVKEKSEVVKLDFSRKEDVDKFFNDQEIENGNSRDKISINCS